MGTFYPLPGPGRQRMVERRQGGREREKETSVRHADWVPDNSWVPGPPPSLRGAAAGSGSVGHAYILI